MFIRFITFFSFFAAAFATDPALNFTASSITRDQIMSRAQVWVDEKVPYNYFASNGYFPCRYNLVSN